jgi:hypothetical protein
MSRLGGIIIGRRRDVDVDVARVACDACLLVSITVRKKCHDAVAA